VDFLKRIIMMKSAGIGHRAALPLAVVLLFSFCSEGKTGNLEQLREQMVVKQIEGRGVRDKRVLSAMRKVERHKFIPQHQINSAYDDHPLPIGHGQTISQPYIVALMTELCALKGTEKVLEIGTGSGYQSAVLSLLAKEVFSIEIVEPLGKLSRQRFAAMGYRNIEVKIGDGYQGWPEKAPFDVIMLTAAPPKIPEKLFEQLREGGVMIAPVGDYFQELVKIEKIDGKMRSSMITHVRFVPMIPGTVKKKTD
jgi:protein-L-isoaspartate(D-aspartate) O-methyltransferase